MYDPYGFSFNDAEDAAQLDAAYDDDLVLTVITGEDDNTRRCRECGEADDDGQGWDGLCGNCADAAENEKEEQ